MNRRPVSFSDPRSGRNFSFFFWFLGLFLVAYYGSYALIGFTTPGGYYSEWLARYFDYISWYRRGLLLESRYLLQLAGWEVYFPDVFRIRVINGSGVHVGYSCLGIGMISFWTAFVFSNRCRFSFMLVWWTIGLLLIFQCNVFRIVLLVIAANKKWSFFLNQDSHFWFNLVIYILILVLMFLFDRNLRRSGGSNLIRS